ncbi:hypothetical protein F4803DRAFT_493850 [Xylaria telfairii]|nr:hypothetical protein F4803DRAFT_493850 [Xylaria telfairii]
MRGKAFLSLPSPKKTVAIYGTSRCLAWYSYQGLSLQTLFSTGFFNWIPNDSHQVISPWAALYFGITILTTTATLWHFCQWAKMQDRDATITIQMNNAFELGAFRSAV